MATKTKSKRKQNEEEQPDSDVDDLDFQNFKGIYFGDKTEKYQDPKTGCHFEYYDLCKRLSNLKQKRKILDKKLGLKTTSMAASPKHDTEPSKPLVKQPADVRRRDSRPHRVNKAALLTEEKPMQSYETQGRDRDLGREDSTEVRGQRMESLESYKGAGSGAPEDPLGGLSYGGEQVSKGRGAPPLILLKGSSQG
jgi:hypothetical protein